MSSTLSDPNFGPPRIVLAPKLQAPSLPSSSPCPRPLRSSKRRRLGPGLGSPKRVKGTERKETRDGTHGGTGRSPDAGAAGLPDDVAHAAAPLGDPGRSGDE